MRLASNEPVSRVVRLACVRVLFPRGTVGSDSSLQATVASGFSDFPSTATHSDSPSESHPRFFVEQRSFKAGHSVTISPVLCVL